MAKKRTKVETSSHNMTFTGVISAQFTLPDSRLCFQMGPWLLKCAQNHAIVTEQKAFFFQKIRSEDVVTLLFIDHVSTFMALGPAFAI